MNFSDALKELNQGKRLHVSRNSPQGFGGYLKFVDNALHYFSTHGAICLANNSISDDKIKSSDWQIYTDEDELFDTSAAVKKEADNLIALEERKQRLIAELLGVNKEIEETKTRCFEHKQHLFNITQLQRDKNATDSNSS